MKRILNYDDAKKRALEATVPTATDSYTPIPHSTFINLLTNKIRNAGLTIVGERLYSSENGNKLIGFYDIENSGTESFSGREIRMMFGFKNSYDKSMRVGLALGGSVVVCGNGIIMGDMMTFRRKHSGTVDQLLGQKISEAITQLQPSYLKLMMEVSVMKDVLLTNTQKAELLGRLYFKEKLLTPTQASILRSEIYTSENFNGNTLWDLYNNVTEVLKLSHPSRQIEDHIKLHTFMAQIAGIVPETTEIEFVEVTDEVANVEPVAPVAEVVAEQDSEESIRLRDPSQMEIYAAEEAIELLERRSSIYEEEDEEEEEEDVQEGESITLGELLGEITSDPQSVRIDLDEQQHQEQIRRDGDATV